MERWRTHTHKLFRGQFVTFKGMESWQIFTFLPLTFLSDPKWCKRMPTGSRAPHGQSGEDDGGGDIPILLAWGVWGRLEQAG